MAIEPPTEPGGLSATQALLVLVAVLTVAAVAVGALLFLRSDARAQPQPVSVAAYASAAASITQSYSTEFSTMSSLLLAPRMSDDGWRNLVSNSATRIKALSVKARQLVPPTCLATVHALLVTSSVEVDEAMDSVLSSVRSRAESGFMATLPRLKQATGGFEAMTAAVRTDPCVVNNEAGTNPASPATETAPADVRIIVDGTPGTQFSGSLGVLGSSRTVQGSTPQTYVMAQSRSYSAFIQKKNRGQLEQLVVTIVCPDGGRHSSSTNADYGVASVAGTCP